MRAARRRLPRTGAIIAVSGLAATGLAGCQLFEIQEPERTPSAIENCVAAHTWVLDPASLTANVTERLAERGASGEVAIEGGQTLRWSIDGDIAVESDLRVTVTNAGPPLTVLTQTVQGAASGQAVFSGDVAVPRNWSDSALSVTESMTQDEVPVEPMPWTLGRTWIDDTVGLVMQCSADTLEVGGRGTKLRWTFHQEGWAPPPVEDEATEETTEG